MSLRDSQSQHRTFTHHLRRPPCAATGMRTAYLTCPAKIKNLHVLFAFLNTRLLRAPRGQSKPLCLPVSLSTLALPT